MVFRLLSARGKIIAKQVYSGPVLTHQTMFTLLRFQEISRYRDSTSSGCYVLEAVMRDIK